MKQYTTRFLKGVAFIYMAFPFLYLFVVSLLFDISGQRCVSILLSPFFYILCIIVVAAGFGLWEMRRWCWYVFLAATGLVVYSNAVLVFGYGETNYKVISFVLSILFLGFIVVRLEREVRVPYFMPKIRWWENNPNYKLSMPVKIFTAGEKRTEFEGEILDFSMQGCFVKVRGEIDPHQKVDLQFTAFGHPVNCWGTVIWRTESGVTHPKGIGIKFQPFFRAQRRIIQAIYQRIKSISVLYRSSRYLITQEEFQSRLKELQTTKLNPVRGWSASLQARFRWLGGTHHPKRSRSKTEVGA